MNPQAPLSRLGLSAAIGSYLLWGILPLYWKQLRYVGALEILAHRVIWAFVFLVLIQAWRGDLRRFLEVFQQKKMFWLSSCSTLLIGMNWFIFVYAVNSGHILDTSLGYFTNPLMYVLLGTFFLGEQLRKTQKVAVVLASIGVVFFGLQLGHIPWISLGLVFSFGFYGFVRKLAPMTTLQGLTIETFWLSIFAGVYLIWKAQTSGIFGLGSPISTQLLLVGAGLVTVVPLILFNVGVRRIPLSIMGFCQYLAPTGSFLIGTLVYHEPFDQVRFTAFTLVWLGLILFTVDGIRQRRPKSPVPLPPE